MFFVSQKVRFSLTLYGRICPVKFQSCDDVKTVEHVMRAEGEAVAGRKLIGPDCRKQEAETAWR